MPYPSLVRLQKEYASTRTEKDSRLQATHASLLNDAADRYTYQLNRAAGRFQKGPLDWRVLKQNTNARVEEANQYGASIFWCEFDGEWSTTSEGYKAYLTQWPKGPYAEEAWWRGQLGHKLNGCFDAEGSEEETRAFVHDYSDFLRHFPHGKHQAQARKLLKSFKADLASYTAR